MGVLGGGLPGPGPLPLIIYLGVFIYMGVPPSLYMGVPLVAYYPLVQAMGWLGPNVCVRALKLESISRHLCASQHNYADFCISFQTA